MSKKILIVEDEYKIRRVIKDYLKREGFSVFEAEDGEQGLEVFRKHSIDLIILDIMLPKMNGWEVCNEIRKDSDVLVIMLTAKSEEEDNLYGYSVGADDYITKPFRVKVLVAKIKALLKRIDPDQGTNHISDFTYNKLQVDSSSRKVYLKGEEVPLTPKEYNLLYYFIHNPNLALSRSQILDEVWGLDYYGGDRTVDACIKRLRGKIGDENLPITAIWGYGYRFETG